MTGWSGTRNKTFLFTPDAGNAWPWKDLINLLHVYPLQDARPPEEYVIGHIPGSVRVNFKSEPEEIIANIPQLQQAGKFLDAVWMPLFFSFI